MHMDVRIIKYIFLIKPFIYISSWISFRLFFTNQVSEKINYKYFCFRIRIRGSRSTGTTESGIETISGVFVYFFSYYFSKQYLLLATPCQFVWVWCKLCTTSYYTYCTFLPMLIFHLLYGACHAGPSS